MSDPITRLNVALEGRYRIERELGEGGMATVYLADDLKHERKVALKVLKPELAAVVGAERFLAEIKTTANLQHPHILPLFDSGKADSFVFYVMPYVEGETLRDRLEREKQLPVDEAVRIASDVAEALHAAHEQGVIHRDIKPANILLSKGRPLVADFGIALAVSAIGGSRLTETGLSLGTPHYMSPEQATGDQHVGPPADIYALACVLYEMLVGEPPFTGGTPQAILGKIIVGAPEPITGQRKSVSENVDAAIVRALEKVPADRFASALDFAAALADPTFVSQKVAHGIDRHGDGKVWRRLGMATTVATVVATVLAMWGWMRTMPTPVPTRATIDLGELEKLGIGDVLVSRRGARFAVAAGPTGGGSALYVRSAAGADFQIVPGTEGAAQAAFSPDGERIVYRAEDQRLMKVDLLGGVPTSIPLGTVGVGSNPYWGADGTIVFNAPGGIYRVADSGGEPSLLFESDYATDPVLVPGGRYVLFTHQQGPTIEIVDIETREATTLKSNALDATYIEETGHLLYADPSGVLWATRFDAPRGELTGEERLVLEGLTTVGAYARYSVSENGTIVYGSGGSSPGPDGRTSRLVQVSLDGRATAEPLDPRQLSSPRWSPDGRSVAYHGRPPGAPGATANQLFTYDVVQGSQPRQLTSAGDDWLPAWSPDGSRIAFSSIRGGTNVFDVFIRDLAASVRLVVSLPGDQYVTQWPEPNTLFVESSGDVFILDLTGWPETDSVSLRPYLDSQADEGSLRLAPQRDLAVYESDVTGTNEIYVQSYPEGGSPERISEGGGFAPIWSTDGTVVYYWLDGAVYAAPIQREPAFSVLVRQRLFDWNVAGLDLHPDGDRFIATERISPPVQIEGDRPEERIFVVTNWFAELRQRMGN